MLQELKAPFPPDRVSWRVGSTNGDKSRGMALAYIDARDVQDRLDAVCQHDWQCRYTLLGQTTVCEIGIRIGNEWVWRADGAGATDFEGEKGALSDAFKRAAVKWGIGRYLYDVDAPWVAIEGAGKSFKIKSDEMAKLRAALNSKAPPQSAPAPSSPPPPAPTPQAKKKTPYQWAMDAAIEINTLKTGEALIDWENANKAALAKLKEVDPPEYESLQRQIRNRYARFSTVNAG